MAQDELLLAETATIQTGATIVKGGLTVSAGGITAAGASASSFDGGNFTTDGSGNITVANLTSSGQSGGMSATATIANAATIATTSRIARITATAAVTQVVVGTGTKAGQELTILHTGAAASSITFCTAGSSAGGSNVATDFVISGLTCSKFVWDVTSALWYPVVF